MIAVDGAYAGVAAPAAASTDGTLELLRSLPKVTLHEAPGTFWPDQAQKRTVYFQHAPPGALLLVVDADESIDGAALLRQRALGADVGWLRVTSPLYRRPYQQPRLFLARPGMHYSRRHHWVYAGTDLMATHQYGGPGFLHRLIDGVTLVHARGLGRSTSRHAATRPHRSQQAAGEGRQVAGR